MEKSIRELINQVRGIDHSSKEKKLIESKYQVIGANSLMEGIAMNGFSINKANDPSAQTIYSETQNEIEEDISYQFDEKGGIIVFSTDVNAIKSSDNRLVNWLKNKVETYKNRFSYNKKINTVINKHEDVYGITIGNFVKGRYKADDGSMYDEKSMSIEIIGVSTETLNSIAEDLAKEFKQETVLVKNYETNLIYLVK
jgi:hypothetical protein